MHLASTSNKTRQSLPRRLTGLLALGLFCWLNLLAIVPHLHHDVCGGDSDSAQHECAATLLAQGKVALDSPGNLVPTPPLPFIFAMADDAPALISSDLRLAPSRGPPSLLS